MGAAVSLKEKRPSTGMNETTTLLEATPIDPYLETVKKKLQGLRQCRKMGENQLHELAECLTDKKKFRERYFDPLLARANKALCTTMEEAETFVGGSVPNELTRDDSRERMRSGYDQVQNLKVELLLFELKDEYLKQELARFFHKYVHQCTYGPFHAALKIGNLILDWDETSLVIPYTAESHDLTAASQLNLMERTLVFRGNIHATDPGAVTAVEIPVRGGVELTAAAFTEQINHLLDITEEKVCLLDTLAEKMVYFNTKQRYGVLSYNCQHFVTEVLWALGLESLADSFQGKTRAFFDVILASRGLTGQGSEFNTHADLDDFVRENNDTITFEELEFCHCHYLLFHAWGQRFDKPAWRCVGDRCQADLIARKIGL